MKTISKSFAVLIPLFWCGMIAGISFLEAPLKFTAPGVTLAIGLSIGSIVFQTFNGVELCLLCTWLVSLRSSKLPIKWVVVGILLLIVGLQSFWLLPALETRALLIRNGVQAAAPSVHAYYVICEVTKFILLGFTGFSLIKKMQQSAIPVAH